MKAFNFSVVDAQNTTVATKTVETNETTASYTVDLGQPGTYIASVEVVTDKGTETSEECKET